MVGVSKTIDSTKAVHPTKSSYLKTEYADGLFVTVKILRMVFAHVIYTCMKSIIFYTAISTFQQYLQYRKSYMNWKFMRLKSTLVYAYIRE